MLRALTLHVMGQPQEAANALDTALAEAPEPQEYVRLFLDEGPAMMTLLCRAAGQRRTPGSPVEVHARRLLQAADGTGSDEPVQQQGGGSDTASGLVDPLSDREVEVLRLLSSELTGPEIAAHLFVSLNTLRTHTKRIFTKLGVRNRAGAVRRGRDLDLL